ncbi:MAG: flagellar motor switch protein FliN [Proteobacteria bacterium]|nr:flagellar motor switch protein FliN [Pseudomonadota bacterium]
MNDQRDSTSPSNGNPITPAQTNVTGPPLSPEAQNSSRSINFLLDIPLELTVEVGRREMMMGELIDIMPGTVVELDRSAGEQLDILANGKLVAHGEAVVVGDRYGVRILEIVGDDLFPQVPDNTEGGS